MLKELSAALAINTERVPGHERFRFRSLKPLDSHLEKVRGEGLRLVITDEKIIKSTSLLILLFFKMKKVQPKHFQVDPSVGGKPRKAEDVLFVLMTKLCHFEY